MRSINRIEVLDDHPFKWEDRQLLSSRSIDSHRLMSPRDPGLATEVGSLSNVKARGEARMIALRKSNDEFSRLLFSSVDRDSPIGEISGGDLDCNVEKEIRVVLMEGRQFLFGGFLKFLSISARDRIPYFGAARMHIIDGRKHDVLVVPAKRAPQHSKIEPGFSDA